MKRAIIKTLSLLIALIMVTGLVAACSDDTAEPKTAGGGTLLLA